ncbi:SCP-like protein [Ostertagia ostertagi]
MLNMLVGYLLLAFQLNSVVQVIAQDAPENCEYNFMSQKMRQAILEAHNRRRSLLADGRVRRNVLSPDFFPTATNMLFMMYDCDLEMKAAYTDPCKAHVRPKSFSYTGMNSYHIKTRVENFRPVKSPENALKEAAEIWWEDHMYYTGFQGVTPREKDYPIIPFLIVCFCYFISWLV